MADLFPENLKEITIYTDGACHGNPGPGGWAALLIYEGHRKTISGGEKNSTNNRMEISAALEALKLLKNRSKVIIYTDSQYLRDGANEWMHKWKQNNWTRGKNPVKNVDLWQALEHEMSKHVVEFRWVKAHNGHPENELVDELANRACKAV